MFACPETINSAWVTSLPQDMFQGVSYTAEWNISTIGFAYEVTSDGAVIHANIHSCLRNVGGCTPFVSNTPGLSTHTAALTGEMSGDTALLATTVSLEAKEGPPAAYQGYTIIAHSRFEVNETGYAFPTRYDVAIGLARDVHPPLVTSSSAAIVTSIAVGGTLLVFMGSIVYAISSGLLSIDAIMRQVMSGPTTAVSAMFLGLGDVISFSITVDNMIKAQSPDTANIIPIAVLVLGLGWIISLLKFRNDALRVHDLFLHRGKGGEEAVARIAARYCVMKDEAEEKKKADASPGTRTRRASLNTLMTREDNLTINFKQAFKNTNGSDVNMEDAIRLAKNIRSLKSLYFIMLTIPLEQLPLMIISMYLMISVGNSVDITETLTLFFASASLGSNVVRLFRFPQMSLERDMLIKKFAALAPGADPTPDVINSFSDAVTPIKLETAGSSRRSSAVKPIRPMQNTVQAEAELETTDLETNALLKVEDVS